MKYVHVVQFTAKPNLPEEDVLKFAIFTLKERLRKEYSCDTIKQAMKEIGKKGV